MVWEGMLNLFWPTDFMVKNHVTYFGYLYLYSDRTCEKFFYYSPDTEQVFMRWSASALSL